MGKRSPQVWAERALPFMACLASSESVVWGRVEGEGKTGAEDPLRRHQMVGMVASPSEPGDTHFLSREKYTTEGVQR